MAPPEHQSGVPDRVRGHPSPTFRLLLISDEAANLGERVQRALVSAPPGSVAVQLRRPDLGSRELLDQARVLRAITRVAGAPLLINDRVDIARLVGADGVHLPERGISVGEARALMTHTCWVGRSCHDPAGLERAAREGADYALLGPLHHVPGKSEPLGHDRFADLCSRARLPVFALGGITPQDVPLVRASGAHGVAVIRAVLADSDPAQRVRDLLAEL